jgi:ECF sigma factor
MAADHDKARGTGLDGRRADVARRYCHGMTQVEIARALGVNQATVSRDLAAIRAQWRQTMAEEFDSLRCEQLPKIDLAERAAWEGWERSQRDAERTRTRKRTGPDGEHVEVSRTVEGQAGDPGFLQTVLTCIDRRLKLIGGYAQDDAPPPPPELVVRVYESGADLRVLHGGRIVSDNGRAGPAEPD